MNIPQITRIIYADQLNQWQKAVINIYADGDFVHLMTPGTAFDVNDLGDGLLTFLLIELSTDQDCLTENDAAGRILSGISDLEAALTACQELQQAVQSHADYCPET